MCFPRKDAFCKDVHKGDSFLCFLNAGCPAETFWRGTTMAVLITTVMIFLYLGMITCLLWSCALQPMASWCISRLMAVRLTIGWPCGKQGYGRFDDETRPKVGVRSHGIHMRRLSVDPMLVHLQHFRMFHYGQTKLGEMFSLDMRLCSCLSG